MGCDQSAPSQPLHPPPQTHKHPTAEQSRPEQKDPQVHNNQLLEGSGDSEEQQEDPEEGSVFFSQDQNNESEGHASCADKQAQQVQIDNKPNELSANQIIPKLESIQPQINEIQVTKELQIKPQQIADPQSLFIAIKRVIKQSKWIQQLIGTDHILSTMHLPQRNALNRQLTISIAEFAVGLLLQQKQFSEAIATKDYQSLSAKIKELGQAESRLREHIVKYNHSSIRHLQYLTKSKQRQQSLYGHCFAELLFDSTFSELHKVVEVLTEILSERPSSGCLLTNYLLRCCKSLQNNGTGLCVIQDKLRQVLQQLQASLLSPDKLNSVNDSADVPILKPDKIVRDKAAEKYLNRRVILPPQHKSYFQFANTSESTQEQLHSFLKNKLTAASGKYRAFHKILNELSKITCHQFAIDDVRMDHCSLVALGDQMFDLSLQQLAPGEAQLMSQFRQRQQNHISKQKEQIYKLIEGPIQFKVSCLCARCWLPTIKDINLMITQLQGRAQKLGYSVIQIRNQLTSDMLRQSIICILMDGVRCDIRLMLIDRPTAGILRGYIRQILHSKRYSIITGLQTLNEQLTKLYFADLRQYLEQISHKQTKSHEIIDLAEARAQIAEILTQSRVSLEEGEKIIEPQFEQLKGLFLQYLQDNHQLHVSKLLGIASKLSYKASIKDHKAVEDLFRQFQHELQTVNVKRKEQNQSDSATDQPFDPQQIYMIQLHALKLTGQNLMLRDNYTKAIQKWKHYLAILKLMKAASGLQGLQAMKMIAKCQHKLGNYNQQLDQLQRYRTQIQQRSDFQIQKYRIIKQMGQIYALQGSSFKALETYNQVAEACLGKEIENTELQSEILKDIGLEFQKTADYHEALIYFRKSLAVLQDQNGLKSIPTVPILSQIAYTIQAQGRNQQALKIYHDILGIVARSRGENSFESIKPLYGIASIHSNQQDYRQAERIYVSCLQILDKFKGKTSAEYGQCCQKLGQIYLATKQHSLSMKYLLKALSLKQKTFGKDTIESLKIIQAIISNYQQQRNHKQEDHYLQRVANIMQKQKINESPNKVANYSNIAQKSMLRGNYPVALNYFQKALKIMETKAGKDSIECVAIHKQMGATYQEQQNYKASIENYQQCLTVLEKEKGKDNMDRAQVLYEIGCVYEKQGKDQAAQECFHETIYLCRKHKVKYLIYAMACFRLAKILEAYQNYSESLQLFTECLPIFHKIGKKEEEQVKLKIAKYRAHEAS